jgi:hypothetical protein
LDADLTQAIFSGAKLTGALLSLAKIDEEILKAADLTGADLRRASYPPDAELPEGWIRGPGGRLMRGSGDPVILAEPSVERLGR